MPARAQRQGGFGWAVVLPHRALPDRKTERALYKWGFRKMPGTNDYLLNDDGPLVKELAESIAEIFNQENY
jgi:hypothetical protein